MSEHGKMKWAGAQEMKGVSGPLGGTVMKVTRVSEATKVTGFNGVMDVLFRGKGLLAKAPRVVEQGYVTVRGASSLLHGKKARNEILQNQAEVKTRGGQVNVRGMRRV